MAESLLVDKKGSKQVKYEQLITQLEFLLAGETDEIAVLSNMMAALKEVFDFFWVGCYLVKDGELVVGPFQGPFACSRIRYGRGVCGKAWEQKETLIVPNVDEFPGHIACSANSKSEIVVPIFDENNEVKGVIDIDSDKLDDFDATDQLYLEQLAHCLTKKCYVNVG